jgi:pyridoxine kinase
MPTILILSSFVAASRVGGGIAPFVLAPLGVDPIHVPTTLLGRHPGWGAPGGGAVSPDQIQGMLDGIEANGLFGDLFGVLTGYFSTEAQIEIAAATIDRIRGALRSGAPPLVMVDPVMGDADTGRYVPEAVAGAQMRLLVPRADLVACNLWELQSIAGRDDLLRPADVAAFARATQRDWLVTSMGQGSGVGALLVDAEGDRLALAPRVAGRPPRGAGDLLKLRFLGGLAAGETRTHALARSVGLSGAIAARAQAMQVPELPLAACHDLLADAPSGWIQSVQE